MEAAALKPLPASQQDRRVPRLQNGDRLTRGEFERRYAAMPDLKKAELIERTVIMPSPVHFSEHAQRGLASAEHAAFASTLRGRLAT